MATYLVAAGAVPLSRSCSKIELQKIKKLDTQLSAAIKDFKEHGKNGCGSYNYFEKIRNLGAQQAKLYSEIRMRSKNESEPLDLKSTATRHEKDKFDGSQYAMDQSKVPEDKPVCLKSSKTCKDTAAAEMKCPEKPKNQWNNVTHPSEVLTQEEFLSLFNLVTHEFLEQQRLNSSHRVRRRRKTANPKYTRAETKSADGDSPNNSTKTVIGNHTKLMDEIRRKQEALHCFICHNKDCDLRCLCMTRVHAACVRVSGSAAPIPALLKKCPKCVGSTNNFSDTEEEEEEVEVETPPPVLKAEVAISRRNVAERTKHSKISKGIKNSLKLLNHKASNRRVEKRHKNVRGKRLNAKMRRHSLKETKVKTSAASNTDGIKTKTSSVGGQSSSDEGYPSKRSRLSSSSSSSSCKLRTMYPSRDETILAMSAAAQCVLMKPKRMSSGSCSGSSNGNSCSVQQKTKNCSKSIICKTEEDDDNDDIPTLSKLNLTTGQSFLPIGFNCEMMDKKVEVKIETEIDCQS